MNILKFFRPIPKTEAPQTAAHARERLKIVLAHERAYAAAPDYLPRLQNEILQAIAKFVEIDRDRLRFNLEHVGTVSRLEVNVELPNERAHDRPFEASAPLAVPPIEGSTTADPAAPTTPAAPTPAAAPTTPAAPQPVAAAAPAAVVPSTPDDAGSAVAAKPETPSSPRRRARARR